MKENLDKFYQEIDVSINNLPENCLEVADSVKSIYVKIEAARSGKVNKNFSVYTPRAMDQGVHSFIYPFNKHLQSQHNGEAVGVIREAEHVREFFPGASKEFMRIVDEVHLHSGTSNGVGLVKAIKELVKTPEYNSPAYKGLGIANIYGDIYDPIMIYELKVQDRSKGKVSIGGKSKEVYCSICSSKVNKKHLHKKGNFYNDELCFYINNDLYLDHCGFVTTPADIDTNTEIVQDEENNALEVDIINYKLTNSMENLMNLNDLKQKAKDLDSVKGIIQGTFTDKADAEVAQSIYEGSLKNSRSNHYLLSKDSVLNLRTPVGIYVAEKMLEDFSEEDTDKAFLREILQNAKQSLKIESTDEALQEALDGKKQELLAAQEAEKASNKDKTAEDDKTATDKDTATDKETTPVDELPKEDEAKVEDEDSSDLVNILSKLLDSKFEAFLSSQKVEDEHQNNKNILEEVTNLRTELQADEKAIKLITEELTESLIGQIVLLKGGDISESYKEKLATRSTEQLRITLEDLKENASEVQKSKNPEKDLQKTTETEVITKVEDSAKEKESEVIEGEEEVETDPEATPENKTEVEDTTKVEDSTTEENEALWYKERIKAVGLSRATKEKKLKFNK